MQRFGVEGVGVEPVSLHVERAVAAVRDAGLADRVTVHQGVMHGVHYPDDHFDFVWCRDVVEQVDDLAGGLREVLRVMISEHGCSCTQRSRPGRLTDHDASMLRRHLGNIDANLDHDMFEHTFKEQRASRSRTSRVIGTEWREHAEERTQPVSRALLRLARLRRQRDDLIADHGHDVYDHIEANLHWEVFQFLGEGEPIVYTLSAA